MHNSPDQIADPWFDERVEAYVDAELPDGERELFCERLKSDAGLRVQVALAEQISLSLAARESVTCDPSLVERLALLRERHAAEDRAADRAVTRIIPLRIRWPVGIAAAAVVAAIFLIGPDRGNEETFDVATGTTSDIDRTYSPEEIDEALSEAKFALALIGDAGRRAGVTLRESVIERNVARPVNRAFENTVYGALPRKNQRTSRTTK